MTMILKFVPNKQRKKNIPEKVSINEYFINFIELHETTRSNMTNFLLETPKKILSST